MSPAAAGLAAAGADDEAAAGDALADVDWLADADADGWLDGESAAPGESAWVWVATTTGDGVIGAADLVLLLQDAKLKVRTAIPAVATTVWRRMAAPNRLGRDPVPRRSQPTRRT